MLDMLIVSLIVAGNCSGAPSVVSASGFFKSGVIYADLKTSGTRPSASERLESSVRNGGLVPVFLGFSSPG